MLHGPYKKLIDDKLVEEGMYFYGTKHQRWVKLTRQNKLISKAHYHKGWYRDSQIDYYDGAGKQRIKSVMPIQYGKKEGVFILFHSSGKMALFPRRQGQAGIFVPSPWRGIAARYKRLAVNYLAMPSLVAVAVCSPVVRFFFSLALKSVTCVTARSRWV